MYNQRFAPDVTRVHFDHVLTRAGRQVEHRERRVLVGFDAQPRVGDEGPCLFASVRDDDFGDEPVGACERSGRHTAATYILLPTHTHTHTHTHTNAHAHAHTCTNLCTAPT